MVVQWKSISVGSSFIGSGPLTQGDFCMSRIFLYGLHRDWTALCLFSNQISSARSALTVRLAYVRLHSKIISGDLISWDQCWLKFVVLEWEINIIVFPFTWVSLCLNVTGRSTERGWGRACGFQSESTLRDLQGEGRCNSVDGGRMWLIHRKQCSHFFRNTLHNAHFSAC